MTELSCIVLITCSQCHWRDAGEKNPTTPTQERRKARKVAVFFVSRVFEEASILSLVRVIKCMIPTWPDLVHNSLHRPAPDELELQVSVLHLHRVRLPPRAVLALDDVEVVPLVVVAEGDGGEGGEGGVVLEGGFEDGLGRGDLEEVEAGADGDRVGGLGHVGGGKVLEVQRPDCDLPTGGRVLSEPDEDGLAGAEPESSEHPGREEDGSGRGPEVEGRGEEGGLGGGRVGAGSGGRGRGRRVPVGS